MLCRTTNGVITKYVYGRGLIGEETSSSFKTYHFDFRGSTIAITDVNGTITDTFAYDTYGKCISHTGTSKVIFGYNGRDGVVTDDNGFIYMRARYYSPEMKRFINADVIAGEISNAVTLNRFAYANGNPVTLVDPFGLSADNRGNHNYSSNYYNKAMLLDEKLKHFEKSPTPIEAAYMARHIYKATNEMYYKDLGEEFGGWKLKDIYENEEGLKIGIYYFERNGVFSYALVNAGSEINIFKDLSGVYYDWIPNNFTQLFGNSNDMKDSIAYAKEFVKNHSSSKITFIGHSKGGAEAAANAVATDRDAILFNPATAALSEYGLNSNNYTASMTAYIVRGEALNELFGLISAPIDEVKYLIDDFTIGDYFGELFGERVYDIYDAIAKHGMDTVIHILERDKAKEKE